MREKELRLALVCYGGISLAVYMHGITKEIWRLASASRAFADRDPPAPGSQGVYLALLQEIEDETGIRLRVLIDIIAGASAGGINGVFLAPSAYEAGFLSSAHDEAVIEATLAAARIAFKAVAAG